MTKGIWLTRVSAPIAGSQVLAYLCRELGPMDRGRPELWWVGEEWEAGQIEGIE